MKLLNCLKVGRGEIWGSTLLVLILEELFIKYAMIDEQGIVHEQGKIKNTSTKSKERNFVSHL